MDHRCHINKNKTKIRKIADLEGVNPRRKFPLVSCIFLDILAKYGLATATEWKILDLPPNSKLVSITVLYCTQQHDIDKKIEIF